MAGFNTILMTTSHSGLLFWAILYITTRSKSYSPTSQQKSDRVDAGNNDVKHCMKYFKKYFFLIHDVLSK